MNAAAYVSDLIRNILYNQSGNINASNIYFLVITENLSSHITNNNNNTSQNNMNTTHLSKKRKELKNYSQLNHSQKYQRLQFMKKG